MGWGNGQSSEPTAITRPRFVVIKKESERMDRSRKADLGLNKGTLVSKNQRKHMVYVQSVWTDNMETIQSFCTGHS